MRHANSSFLKLVWSVVIGMTGTACSGDLSRPVALEILKEKAKSEGLSTGDVEVRIVASSAEAEGDDLRIRGGNDYNRVAAGLRDLMKHGLMEPFEELRKGRPDKTRSGKTASSWYSRPTAKGRSYIPKSFEFKDIHGRDVPTWIGTFYVGTTFPTKITGMTKQAGLGVEETRVDFEYDWELTPFGEAAKKQGGPTQRGIGQKGSASALFRKYDDGWRLEHIYY